MSKQILKKRSKTNWVKVDAASDDKLDYSGIPEQGDAFFKNATLKIPESKATVTMRMDKDVLEWQGTGERLPDTHKCPIARLYGFQSGALNRPSCQLKIGS